MFNLFFCVCVLCGVFSRNVKALSLEELRKMNERTLEDMMLECLHAFPVQPHDLVQLLKTEQMSNDRNMMCHFACIYKISGIMNDKGELWEEGVRTEIGKNYRDDYEKIKVAQEFLEACKSVNDVDVSDGEEGCERAALIFKCAAEKAPEVGLADHWKIV